MSGHIDQVSPEVLDDMRVYINACSDQDGYGMTDEEVLATMDTQYRGGAAQFNREQASGEWSSDVNR